MAWFDAAAGLPHHFFSALSTLWRRKAASTSFLVSMLMLAL